MSLWKIIATNLFVMPLLISPASADSTFAGQYQCHFEDKDENFNRPSDLFFEVGDIPNKSLALLDRNSGEGLLYFGEQWLPGNFWYTWENGQKLRESADGAAIASKRLDGAKVLLFYRGVLSHVIYIFEEEGHIMDVYGHYALADGTCKRIEN